MALDEKKHLLGTDDVIVWEDAAELESELKSTDHGPGETGKETEFAQLFAEAYQEFGKIKEGEIITGKVTKIASDAVIVDIGHKTDGEIPSYEFKNDEGHIPLKLGDEIDIFLESFENKDGQLVLSYEKAQLMKAWDKLADAYEKEGGGVWEDCSKS